MQGIVSTEELLEVTGYTRAGDLCRCMDNQGIRYFLGRYARPWTTLDLINAAGGLAPGGPTKVDTYDPDDA